MVRSFYTVASYIPHNLANVPAIVIIFIAAFFPVLPSTVAAVGNIDPIYLKVSKNFGIRQPKILWKVVLPAAFPQIANGIHLALGTAWVFLVAGEMIGSQSGLVYMIIDSRNNLRADTLLAAIIVIGVIGLLLDTLLKILEKRVLSAWGRCSVMYIDIQNASKTFLQKGENFTAFENVSLSIEKSEFICLLAPSGCGKVHCLYNVALLYCIFYCISLSIIKNHLQSLIKSKTSAHLFELLSIIDIIVN